MDQLIETTRDQYVDFVSDEARCPSRVEDKQGIKKQSGHFLISRCTIGVWMNSVTEGLIQANLRTKCGPYINWKINQRWYSDRGTRFRLCILIPSWSQSWIKK